MKHKDIFWIDIVAHPSKRAHWEIAIYDIEGRPLNSGIKIPCAKSSPVGSIIEALAKHLAMHVNIESE